MGENEKKHEEQHPPFDPKNPQVIYAWRGPLRAYIKRSKKIIRFYLALALLLSLIIVFFADFILLIPIWTLLFLFYALTITPPQDIETRITQFGIETAGTTIRWGDLSHFYFTHRFSYEILTLITHPPYFDHFFIVVPTDQIRERVIKILSEHIMYQDVPKKNSTDKIIDWFLKFVPQESEGEIENLKSQTKLSGVLDKLSSLKSDQTPDSR